MSNKAAKGNRAQYVKDTRWKPGQSGNPKGRPKKARLPADVGQILSTASPEIMKAAIKECLGYPDKDGEPTKTPNTRIMAVLLDKLAPSLKSVEIKGQDKLPTMILVSSSTDPQIINQLKGSIVEHQAALPLPKEYEQK